MYGLPNLLLDVGNTSIKYAFYYRERNIADLQILRTTLDGLADIVANASYCLFCNVRGNDITEKIIEICQQQQVGVEQVITPKEQFGIQNAYNTPSNMGTDRWMAIIAGGALSHRNYLVVDAGTAITCDFIVAGSHIGGWIAPGLALARNAVVKNTNKVFDNEYLPTKLAAGDDTPHCVAQGALAQVSGMLAQAKMIMYQHGPQFDVFISGGDAQTLIQASTLPPNYLSKDDMAEGESTKKQQSVQKSEKNAIILPNDLGTNNYLENLVLVGLARVLHEKP